MKLIILVFTLISITASCSDNQFLFCDNVNTYSLCAKNEYAMAVTTLPICCVDIFVYNPTTQKYFMVMRKQKPAQHEWWYPGGRLFKGESFFACAQRKCLQECGLNVLPQKILSVYSTIFPDSEWDCQTHTVNIAVFAVLVDNHDGHEQLDDNHDQYDWIDLNTQPTNPYLHDIYLHATQFIANTFEKN
ncbi:hypothetical protein Noda2021_00670 [Candidatus Dependentiae bacterium Noda2021]|nr:hypothetical protein Noda2021_00670 [Candidatus Dependentiae bacterium Noda2021]